MFRPRSRQALSRGPARARGLSLVELMVSTLLGLLLSLGIVSVYLDSKLNFTADEEVARMQENGRFALATLKRELTLAGFFAGDVTVPAMAAAAVTTDCAVSNWALDPSEPLELIDNFSSSTVTINGTALTCLSDGGGVPVQAGTDIVTVKRTAGDFTVRDGVYQTGVTGARETQWYLRRADYGEAKNWQFIGAGGDFDPADIGAGSRVDYWEYYSRIFYLRDYSNTPGDNIPSLCVEQLSGDHMATQCLVEGVEDMQIEFGIDTTADGVPNLFKGAPSAAEIDGAVVARVYLLLRSINPVSNYVNTKTYQLGQKAVAAKNDGYFRRVMSTTVQTRNAALPLAG